MAEFLKEFRNGYFCIELSITLSSNHLELLFPKVHRMNFFIYFLFIFPIVRVTHLFTADFFFKVTLHEI